MTVTETRKIWAEAPHKSRKAPSMALLGLLVSPIFPVGGYPFDYQPG